MKLKQNQAFTLIELLIVIAIIGLLASIVAASTVKVRAKARDVVRKQDLRMIQTAMELYYENTGAFPANQTPCCGYPDDSANFLNELVTTGLLPKTPHAPAAPVRNPYYYYDYGSGNTIGALLVTNMESESPSVTGDPGTCRPWAAGQNWCDQSSSTQYCLCYPH